MVGIAWSMTPTVGIQMPIVLVNWYIARKLFKWEFHLLNGLAWTWVSNVFTLLPLYYLFFLTGQIMLARFDDISGYERVLNFVNLLEETKLTNLPIIILESWYIYGSMLLGCVPWAILSGWVSYIWCLAFVRQYRARRTSIIKEN